MKTFKMFREDLQQTMSKEVAGVPLSAIAKRKEGIKQQAELERQSKLPTTNPMKMDDPKSTYAKTSGGVVKFPRQDTVSPTKMATPSAPSSTPSSTSVQAPIKQFQGITPEIKKDGSVQSVQKAVSAETKTPKPPSIKRQVSTMVGNTKAASIRKASKPDVGQATKTLPTVNVTATKEKDPNVGGGFVTAAVSKGPSGELRTKNIARGAADITAMPHKKTGLNIPLQKPSNVPSAPARAWQTPAKGLPPQGTAARDATLAKSGYKKF
jgi:hypothetical protein